MCSKVIRYNWLIFPILRLWKTRNDFCTKTRLCLKEHRTTSNLIPRGRYSFVQRRGSLRWTKVTEALRTRLKWEEAPKREVNKPPDSTYVYFSKLDFYRPPSGRTVAGGGSADSAPVVYLVEGGAESQAVIFCLFLFLVLYIVAATVRKSLFNSHST